MRYHSAMTLNMEDAEFRANADRAFRIRVRDVRAALGRPGDAPDARSLPGILLVWSAVHGFAHLSIDQRLTFLTGHASHRSSSIR